MSGDGSATAASRYGRAPIAFPAGAWNALMIAGFVTGTVLRAWQIDIQILIDDEWHAIHKLLRSDALDIVTHLGYADYSIPLTLYYRMLYRTIGLSEWSMHVPALLAGIALLLVGPRLLARWAPLSTRAVWTTLVAISPLLVYHSKVARPYALTSLLAFVAIVAFRRWWLERRSMHAAIYVVATFLAGWLHPLTLPFTLSPFLYYGVCALRPLDRVAWTRLMALGVATVAPLAFALLPPLLTDWADFSHKAARDSVTLESAYRTALMLAGTASPLVAALSFVAAVAGFRTIMRRDADLGAYLATVVGVPALVVASTGAEWISHPLVLARYLIPALPFVLLFVAEGMVTMLSHASPSPAAMPASVAVVAGAFFMGPIPQQWAYPNQFWGHLRYQFDYDPAHNPYVQLVPKDPLPRFYIDLAARPPGSVTLIETPWRLESHFNPQSLYQSVHHQLIRIGLVTPVCGTYDFGEYAESRSGLRMRELVHLSAVLRGETGGADYLVVHTQARNVAADPGPLWPDVRGCLSAIEAKLGTPLYRDEQMVVFALSALSSLGNSRRPVQQ